MKTFFQHLIPAAGETIKQLIVGIATVAAGACFFILYHGVCLGAEWLDEENGILLSPHYDALFDKHLISFEDTGDILLSDKLSNEQLLAVGSWY